MLASLLAVIVSTLYPPYTTAGNIHLAGKFKMLGILTMQLYMVLQFSSYSVHMCVGYTGILGP